MNRPATGEFRIEVPGTFRRCTAYLDLETKKVPTNRNLRAKQEMADFFVMQNGEVLRSRWSIIMYGVALNGGIVLSDNDTEEQNLTGLGDILSEYNLGAGSGGFMEGHVHEVAYAATRDFDEMIAKGRFTNARRAHEPVPFFTPVPGADQIQWRNLGPKIPNKIAAIRQPDIQSESVPRFIESGHTGLVRVHLLRDVVQLIIWDGRPDEKCLSWCERVLFSYDFALGQIDGGE
jgi:hypothetical protein